MSACTRRAARRPTWATRVSAGVALLLFALSGLAATVVVDPAAPNAITFAAKTTRFVRFAVHATSGAQACVDELEVYGPEGGTNLALAAGGAKPSASSCLSGYAIHRIEHLNDGLYGNDRSWIAAGDGDEWAQVELGRPATVDRVVFSRDRTGQYSDRVPTSFEVLLSTDGTTWESVAKVEGKSAGGGPARPGAVTSVAFRREHTRYVRIFIRGTVDDTEPCLEEVELYGAEAGKNLALAANGARASASSCRGGDPHLADLLNDGKYSGAASCWTAAGPNRQWLQIDLPDRVEVDRVLLARDHTGRTTAGMPTRFEVQLSLDGSYWRTVYDRGRGILPGPSAPPVVRGPDAAAVPALEATVVPKQDELGFPNLALGAKAKPSASSCLAGFPIHQVPHLTDAQYGNSHSWISAAEPSWAEVDLGDAYWVWKVALGSDSSGQYSDRAATRFRILAATEYDPSTAARTWHPVFRQSGGTPVRYRTEFRFRPVQARWLRIAIEAANQSACRLDEIEVYGQSEPIALEKLGALPPDTTAAAPTADNELLREAFVGEEHAWLKTFGRADLDTRLEDYVRVWNYPRHVADDLLPLPPLASLPTIDGDLSDPAWQGASRGVVRVAWPDDVDRSPLVEQELWAGWRDDVLLLGCRTDRLLSGNLAVVSGGDWRGCGVVVYGKDGFVFNTYGQENDRPVIDKSEPVKGAFNRDLTAWEVCLPLAWFPGCRLKGIRVGLGLGGRHTRPWGRGVEFSFSPLSVAEQSPCLGGTFRVRLGLAAGAESATVSGNCPELASGLSLAPGQSQVVTVPARSGPIGPEYDLSLRLGNGDESVLHLFRYDPQERVLSQTEQLAARLAGRGVDVGREQDELRRGREHQAQLLAAAVRDPAAERQAFWAARLAQRQLFLREPELTAIERILFVKRHPFQPSHNYSDYFDSAWRPGGGVWVLNIPRPGDRFEPDRAEAVRLFDAGSGVARNPMASFDLSRVYFGYRASAEGYYHLMAMGPDGSGLTQLTDGPYHDFWPCPLPDGGLAFISTRCRARFLCWRPQASVLFRMDANGQNLRPLSFANLTEWGPSVMSDGRIIWQRSEYVDKGADFSHTLWAIRPDGSHPELIFGNAIIQPNGYANGRQVPGTHEISCTLISHFGDLNGPIALVDTAKGRFTADAITSITPEVPWCGLWPAEECFREAYPIARDYFLCAHAPRDRFGLFVIDRFGNRELLYTDPAISSMCPTPFRVQAVPPVLAEAAQAQGEPETGEFVMADVYAGISPPVERGQVKYLRVVQEVRAELDQLPNGEFRSDHPSFMDWYATPVHLVNGPFGWPSYVAKASWGLVPVAADGSARFTAPAGKVLYFQALDKDFNELQRMRSVVQLQPGETRSCVGCHESRQAAAPRVRKALASQAYTPKLASWEGRPFAFEREVQPVLDQHCVRCHDAADKRGLNLTGTLDQGKVPASYRTLVSRGLVHYLDYSYNPGGNEKVQPLMFGSLRSRLWQVLDAGHHEVKLTDDEKLRLKAWIDLNCPLWPDYLNRELRPGPGNQVSQAE